MIVGSVVARIWNIRKTRIFYLAAMGSLFVWGGLRYLPMLVHDRYILSGLLSIFCAQGMKPITVKTGNSGLAWKKALRCGGMPSSHAAVAASLAASLGFEFGWTSPLFQVAAVLGSIVIYDAITLRRVVGEHSILLKELVKNRTNRAFPLLGEMVGHTPLEASMGVLIGIICAALVVRF